MNEAATPPAEKRRPVGVFRRRWRKLRTLKRGWYSLLILAGLYLVSLFNPLLINNRALVVSYGGELYFPALAESWLGRRHAGTTFGQPSLAEAKYRKLATDLAAEGKEGWVLMPPYPYHPNENLLREEHLAGNPPHAPNAKNWLGTDDRGRDVFARLAYGFRISITFAASVVFLSYLIGVFVGSCLGFFGGRLDFYGQRLVEIWAGLPFLYTIIIVSSLIRPSVPILVVLLAAFNWVGISYYMRGEFYRERAKDYVAAGISQGESSFSLMFRHILPNALTPVISFAPFAIVGNISVLVALDYLGFGLPPPTPSWGELVDQGLTRIQSWHLVIFPLGALFATLILVVFIGEAVREAFDPKTHARLR